MLNGSLRVLLISGSVNKPSHTLANIQLASELLREAGAYTEIWDLGELPLPIHEPAYHSDPSKNPSEAIRHFSRLADEAAAFVWATPVYHNSFSGVLKNALDNLHMRHFQHKPIALISNGGDRSGVQPCDQMRIVARGLLAVAIPSQIVTIESDFDYSDQTFRLTDTKTARRFEHMVHELIGYAHAMKSLREPAL